MSKRTVVQVRARYFDETLYQLLCRARANEWAGRSEDAARLWMQVEKHLEDARKIVVSMMHRIDAEEAENLK